MNALLFFYFAPASTAFLTAGIAHSGCFFLQREFCFVQYLELLFGTYHTPERIRIVRVLRTSLHAVFLDRPYKITQRTFAVFRALRQFRHRVKTRCRFVLFRFLFKQTDDGSHVCLALQRLSKKLFRTAPYHTFREIGRLQEAGDLYAASLPGLRFTFASPFSSAGPVVFAGRTTGTGAWVLPASA
jgi:hypothetical protein